MSCSRCNDPDGWVSTPDGLIPCAWCRQSAHQRWSAGAYGPNAPAEPGDAGVDGRRPPATMSPPVADDPLAVQAEFASRYGQGGAS